MATISQSKRPHFLSNNRSGSSVSSRSFSAPVEHSVRKYPRVFQGTDAVPQNQRVALHRIIDTHQALDLKYEQEQVSTPTSTTSGRPTSSSSSILSNDPFALDLNSLPVQDAEIRAFRYLLRLWDPKSYPADPEFDSAIAPRKAQFEEKAIKHFINRVALWDVSGDASQGMTRSIFAFRRRRSRAKSVSQTLNEGADEGPDALKEATTREGLAQLIWTLLHDPKVLNESALGERCMEALKEMYRLTSPTG
ncbi:hypothetical protein GGP41_008077 [Bipolaris sorokiniana]|uniref:Uncharacterized protein n=2 Tax=Cochliobolus sativus TaxID=45130 RepID=A0A8H5ZNG8_COCSA|nr:uncharacterized protein COCSADRAFT_35174 [Bipolaris sorokiniana ND90Pr]EMD66666.1 hypothetical protein COCSADRAFT_35174 [Bipolaris sorokiniana ND90Pr]KAF5852667.1 hypothetical protein GGP41_008077 [Bipolaris sorokiniana]